MTIKLRPFESVVEFISYSHLPLLFENQNELEDDLERYEYYISSQMENRLDNKAYKVLGAAPVTETVNGVEVTLSGINLRQNFEGGQLRRFYPQIRVINWKNTYDAVFNGVGTDYYSNGDFLQALGWGTPVLSKDTIVTKYKEGTKMGENWMKKLVEITFAHLKYGKPLKNLNSTDLQLVDNIYRTVLTDVTRHVQLNEGSSELSIEIAKSAFSGVLY